MSTPHPGGPPADGGKLARATAVVRSWGVVRGEDRWFAGVCGGLATRTGLDPVLVRGLLIALVLVGGLGLALYGLAWAVLPDARGRVELEAAARGDVSGALALAAGLVLLDLAVGRGVVGLAGVTLGPLGGSTGWGFLVTGLVAALLWWLFRDRIAAACARHPERPDAPATSPRAPGAPTAVLREDAPTVSLPTVSLPTVSLRKGPVPPATGPADLPDDLAGLTTDLTADLTAGPAAGFGSTVERRAAAREQARAAARRARARRRPGSPLLTTLTLGAAMLAAGAVVLAELLLALPAPAHVLAPAAALAVVGAGAVAAGLAGRRTALVGFGWPLAVLTVLAGTLPPSGGWHWDVDGTWAPTAASVREQDAVSSAVGRLRVDPSDVAAGEVPGPITATLAAGRLEVVAPAGTTVLVDARALAGSLRWDAASGDVVPVASGDRALVATGASGDGGGVEGGLDTRRVLAAGPDAARVAAATEVDGEDAADWTVPGGVAVVRAVVWAGEVRVGAAGSALLEGE
ncbi:PspC domain-containing protein [Kineococcus arenarius]|uniref:PspC domain-containing protein n=1 Tax=unclassified Kineococcus TaxID=2621656 RepID=UPI003D7E158F